MEQRAEVREEKQFEGDEWDQRGCSKRGQVESEQNDYGGIVSFHQISAIPSDYQSPSSNRINVEPPAEVFLDECLSPRSSAAEATIAQSNKNPIAWIHIAILNIHNHGFLERSLVSLLIKSNGQGLNCRGGLFWEKVV